MTRKEFYSSPVWEKLISYGTTMQMKKGSYLRMQGNFSEGVYILIDGVWIGYRIDAHGNSIGNSYCPAPAIAGDVGAFIDEPYDTNVVCLTDCKVAFISQSVIKELIKNNYEITLFFATNLAIMLHHYTLIVDYPHYNSYKRLVRFFLDSYTDTFILSHFDLAEIMAVSRPCITANLNQLESLGAITTKTKKIQILSRDVLRKIMQEE